MTKEVEAATLLAARGRAVPPLRAKLIMAFSNAETGPKADTGHGLRVLLTHAQLLVYKTGEYMAGVCGGGRSQVGHPQVPTQHTNRLV